MSWRPPYGEDENPDEFEEADEDLKDESIQLGRDCLIYLVDVSQSMHSHSDTDDGRSAFQNVIKSAANYQLSKIISSDSDFAGIVFYGTNKSSNSHNFENIYVYQDLDAPSARRISDLETLETNPDMFQRDIGSSDEYAFHEALWICNTMFSKTAKKMDTKRIFILTNNDNPNKGRLDLQRSAVTRANDLKDTGVIIHLMFFDPPPPAPKFDVDVFFKSKILEISEDAEDGDDVANSYHDATGRLNELMRQVKQKEFRKRTAFRVPLIFGQDFEIGVQGYNLVTEAKPGTYTYLVGATNEEAKVVTSYICKTTGQQLSSTDMDSYYLYGGNKVVFTKDEVAAMKTFGEPGLRLIGFKPKEQILRKPYYNLKHSAFIYPDETQFSGSSSVFIQLLARMHALGKAMICSFIARRNASPRLVALIPQLEEFDDNGYLLKPSGFHLLHLPFNDDIRKPPAPSFDSTTRVPELAEAVKVFGEIIDKTTFKDFTPDTYENPTIQTHYQNLQAIALKRDMASDVKDQTLPDEAAIQRRIAKLVTKLQEALPAPAYVPPTPTNKRKAAKDDDGGAARPTAKRERVAGPVLDIKTMKEHYNNGTLKKLTNAGLSEFLSSVRVKPAKKKDDLIAQVDHFFASQE